MFINCQVAFWLSEFLKVASTGCQSGHVRRGFPLFSLLLALSDSRTTMFKPPLGCYLPSEPWLGSVVVSFHSRGVTKTSLPVVISHFMCLPNISDSSYYDEHPDCLYPVLEFQFEKSGSVRISILFLPYLTEESRKLRHFSFFPTFIYNSIKSYKWQICFPVFNFEAA